jgi:fatty acid desaturase
VTEERRRRRRRTGFWFAFYTVALLAIAGVSAWTHQWSVAVTTLMVAAVFFLFTRWFVRRR